MANDPSRKRPRSPFGTPSQNSSGGFRRPTPPSSPGASSPPPTAPTPTFVPGVRAAGSHLPRPFSKQPESQMGSLASDQPGTPQNDTTIFEQTSGQPGHRRPASAPTPQSQQPGYRELDLSRPKPPIVTEPGKALSEDDLRRIYAARGSSAEQYTEVLANINKVLNQRGVIGGQKLILPTEGGATRVLITDEKGRDNQNMVSNPMVMAAALSNAQEFINILKEKRPDLVKEYELEGVGIELLREWGGVGDSISKEELEKPENIYKFLEVQNRVSRAAAAFTKKTIPIVELPTAQEAGATSESTQTAIKSGSSGGSTSESSSDSDGGDSGEAASDETVAPQEEVQEPEVTEEKPPEEPIEEPVPEDTLDIDVAVATQEAAQEPDAPQIIEPTPTLEPTTPEPVAPAVAESTPSEPPDLTSTPPAAAVVPVIPPTSAPVPKVTPPQPKTSQAVSAAPAAPKPQTQELAAFFESQISHDLFGARFIPTDSIPQDLKNQLSEHVRNSLDKLDPRELKDLQISSTRKERFTRDLSYILAQSRFGTDTRAFYLHYLSHPDKYAPLSERHRQVVTNELQKALQNPHLVTEIGTQNPYLQFVQDAQTVLGTDSQVARANLAQIEDQLPAIMLTYGPERAREFFEHATPESLRQALYLPPDTTLSADDANILKSRLQSLISLKETEITLEAESHQWKTGLIPKAKDPQPAGRQLSVARVQRDTKETAELVKETDEKTAVHATVGRKSNTRANFNRMQELLTPYWNSIPPAAQSLIFADLGLNPNAFVQNYRINEDLLPLPAGFFEYSQTDVQYFIKQSKLSPADQQRTAEAANKLLAQQDDVNSLHNATVLQEELQQDYLENLPPEHRAALAVATPQLYEQGVLAPSERYVVSEDYPDGYIEYVVPSEQDLSVQELSNITTYLDDNPTAFDSYLAQSPEYAGAGGRLRSSLGRLQRARGFDPRTFTRSRIGNLANRVKGAKNAFAALKKGKQLKQLATLAKLGKATNPLGWTMLAADALKNKHVRTALAGAGLGATLALSKVPGWLGGLFNLGSKAGSAVSSLGSALGGGGGGGGGATSLTSGMGGMGTPLTPVSTSGFGIFSNFAGKAAAATTAATSSMAFTAVAASLGFAAFTTIMVLMVIQGAFIIPAPTGGTPLTVTGNNGSAVSKYMGLTKDASTNHIANNELDAVTFTIAIAPKNFYMIEVTSVTDEISVISENPHSIPEHAPLDPEAFQPGPHSSEVATSYAMQLTAVDALVTNTVTVTYNAIDTRTNQAVSSGETLTTSAVVVVGNPQIACWPTSGKLVQGPGGSFSHTNLDAYDIINVAGTPIYAPFSGTVCEGFSNGGTNNPNRNYGNHLYLTFSYRGSELTLIFGHFIHPFSNNRHMQSLPVAPANQLSPNCRSVLVGQQIGDMGTTGFSTGPHLHYELLRNPTNIKLDALIATGEPIRIGETVTSCFGAP